MTALPPVNGSPLLSVRGLCVDFASRSAWGWARRQRVRVLHDVSFDVAPGETFAVVGESGSGKTTLARTLMRLVSPSAGSIELAGQDWLSLKGAELRRRRREVQIVFQDPYSSLNPSMLVRDLVAEPLRIHERLDSRELELRAVEALRQVGLGPECLDRYPHEFSGGQRQRIAIARALILSPRLIVLDEPVSALDLPMQNQIINLLGELRGRTGTAYLLISHDLGLVRHIAQRVAVMQAGRVVECGPTSQVFEAAAHPYTRQLIASLPVPDPSARRRRRVAMAPVEALAA